MKFAHSFAALALCSLAAIASAAPTFPVTVNVTVRAFRSPEQWALGESFAKGRA